MHNIFSIYSFWFPTQCIKFTLLSFCWRSEEAEVPCNYSNRKLEFDKVRGIQGGKKKPNEHKERAALLKGIPQRISHKTDSRQDKYNII